MMDAYWEFAPQMKTSPVYPTDMFNRFGMAIGVLGGAVGLWFLVTRRKVFLEACKAPVGLISASNTPLSPQSS
jgi:hypothetical protein